MVRFLLKVNNTLRALKSTEVKQFLFPIPIIVRLYLCYLIVVLYDIYEKREWKNLGSGAGEFVGVTILVVILQAQFEY